MAATAAPPPEIEIAEPPLTSVRGQLPRAEPAAEPTGPALYRLSIEQYEAMGKAEILDEYDRVELVDGLLVKKMTKHGPHRVATEKTFWILAKLVLAGWRVCKEDPIRIPGRAGEPEPDITVVKGVPDDNLIRHPEPSEVALVVEVSESSLEFDRGAKLQMYAGGRIPTYWIVNVVDRQLEVYTEPSGPDVEPAGYRRTAILKPGESVTFTIEGVDVGPVAVADLLP